MLSPPSWSWVATVRKTKTSKYQKKKNKIHHKVEGRKDLIRDEGLNHSGFTLIMGFDLMYNVWVVMDLFTTGKEIQSLSSHWPWCILTLCFQPWQSCVWLWLMWNSIFVSNISYIFYCSLTCVSINFYRTWYSSGSHLIKQVRAHPSNLYFRPRKSLCMHPVWDGRGKHLGSTQCIYVPPDM